MIYREFLDRLFHSFQTLEEKTFEGSSDFDLLRNEVFNEIAGPKIREFFLEQIDKIIDEKFSFYKKDFKKLRKDREVSQYEFSISGYTCLIIYWMWQNKLKVSEEEIYKLIEAILIGMLGYRIIDLQHDQNKNSQHIFYLGRYLIQIHQSIILEIFNDPDANIIINKHIEKYTIVEYLEKKNKWVGCPFSWDKPEMLGYKAAPFFYILELISRKLNKGEEYTANIERGFVALAAAVQMMDDVSDALDDLQNGTESLSMSGFYNQYGAETKITRKLIDDFLTPERTMLIFNTTEKLFDIARKTFTENNDLMFALSIESFNERFHKGVQVIN